MTEVLIRPMTVDDVAAAERLSDETFFELDTRLRAPGGREPERRDDSFRAVWLERTAHFVTTDPGGSWVAEDADGLVGMATSYVRDSTWILATFTVRPGEQGRGLGRGLLDRATAHGKECSRGMLCASADPKALRSYHRIGFDLHPYMHFKGTVRRSAIPATGPLREGTADDVDLLDTIDRRARGAAHGPDHPLLQKHLRLVVDPGGRGYAYLRPASGDVALLAAIDEETATRIVWAALAEAPGEVSVGRVTPAARWAVDVGMAAGLSLRQDGYLALRGMAPPSTYLPDGMFL